MQVGVWVAFAVGCFLGSLVSFPLAVALLRRATRKGW